MTDREYNVLVQIVKTGRCEYPRVAKRLEDRGLVVAAGTIERETSKAYNFGRSVKYGKKWVTVWEVTAAGREQGTAEWNRRHSQ